MFIFNFIFQVKRQNRQNARGCKAKVKLYKHLLNIIGCECTDGLSDAVLKITITPPRGAGQTVEEVEGVGTECLAFKVCQTP